MGAVMGNMPGLQPLQRRDGSGRVVPVHEPEVKAANAQGQHAAAAQARIDALPPGRRSFDDIARAARGSTLAYARTPEPENKIDVAAWRLDSFTKGIPPKQKFLLDPLFPLGVAGVLFGPGGVGKSLVALDLCLAVARRALMPPGGLGFVAGPLGGSIPAEGGGASIFLTLEDGKDDIHRRAVSLDPGNSRAGLPCFVIPGVELADFEPSLVRNEDRVATLTRFAKGGLERLLDDVEAASGFPARLLVLDPAGDFISGPENDADFVKPLMRRLREIATTRQCTIMLIGHVSKTLDPGEPTMRGSIAWIANSRFAFALTKPAPEKRGSKRDMRGIVVGCLVKANHRSAPIDRRDFYRMDKDTGRLVNVTASLGGTDGAQDSGEPTQALIDGIGAASEAGHAYTRTGPSGLYERRGEFPPCLSDISKRRIWALADAAIADGWVTKLADGRLVLADDAELTEDDDTPPDDA